MSLKVWLPLNGTLENLGVSNVKIENMGAVTSNASGKIGSCMSFTGAATSYLRLTPILSTGDCSIAFWLKINSHSTHHTLYSQRVTNNATGFTIFHYNGGNLRFDDGSTLEVAGIPVGEWHHIVCCRDSTKKYIYIDGVLKGSAAKGSPNPNVNYALIGGSQNNAAGTPSQGTTNSLNGYLNDYRIYDHCLSAAEVHEISQGLVLHYKLDSFQGMRGNANLLKSTPKSYNSSAYCAYQLNFTENLVANQTYTLQLWDVNVAHSAKSAANLGIAFYWGGGSVQLTYPKGTSYFTDGHADYIKVSFTPTEANASHSNAANLWFNVYNSPSNADGTRSMSIGKWKLEKGSSATSWQDSNDILNIIQDSSGYGYNGTIVNTPVLISDTPRYSAAINFNENTDSIKIKPIFSSGQTIPELSVACWFKTNTLNSTAPNIFSLGANNFCRARIASATSIWWYTRVASTSAGVTKSCKTLTDNIWHHIVYTFKNGIETMYVDGTSVGTNDKTGTGTTLTCSSVEETYWALAGYSTNSENFIGNESDFRIYCTALSAADAKQLYELGAKVDNKGNLHCYELKEYSTLPKFHKNGIVQHKILYETGLLNNITSFSYKPAANTNNSCTNGAILDFTAFANEGQSVTFSIEYDVSWSGLSAGTGGTFRTLIQGSNRLKSNNSWAWQGSNYFTGFNFTSSVTSNATGSIHKTATATIPASWFDTYNGSYFGFRTDYANGTGTVSISNLKVTVQSNIFKLKKSSIMTNNLIEF